MERTRTEEKNIFLLSLFVPSFSKYKTRYKSRKMPHKLIIIIEIPSYHGEDPKKVKMEFNSDLIPISRSRIKLLNGPSKYLDSEKGTATLHSANIFEAIISSESISFFPENNTITILLKDYSSFNSSGSIKIAEIIKEYTQKGWELVK